MQDESGKESSKKDHKDSESSGSTSGSSRSSVVEAVLTPIRKLLQPKKKVIGSFFKTDKWKALGRGGYGEVFRVDEWMDINGKQRESIALKKANPQPGAETLLQKEMKSLSKLNHLFVVKYLGLAKMEDKNGKSTAIAMELCEGDLKTYVLEGLPNIPKGSQNNRVLLGQVVLGLTYIHGLGIIHKDLKPDNILLWKSPSGLVLAKLADFGFSKGLRNKDQTEHSDTTHLGTPGYKAPELLIAEMIDDRNRSAKCSYASDAFALGITISFTANGGQHPFGQNRYTRDFLMSLGTAPIDLDADWDLTDLVSRLTQNDPTKRPPVGHVIYHPYFSLGNHRTKINYIDKLYNFFESYSSWTYKLDDMDSGDMQIKLRWFQENFCHDFSAMQMLQSQDRREDQMTSSSISSTSSGLPTAAQTTASLSRLIPSPSTVTSCPEELKEIASSKPFSFDEKIKERLSSNTKENNIAKNIKLTDDFTRLHIYSLMTSIAPEMLFFYIWCLVFKLTPFVLTTLASTNDHFKKCFEMTEFEFATLHYTDENVREIWDLKYKTEDTAVSTVDEDPQPLFVYTASSLFPTFMWETLVQRFENHINCTKNGIKERSLLSWVAFNEAPTDSTNESPEHFIRLILEKGGNPNKTDIFGLTPVHMAARNVGHHACTILKVLLEEGRGNPNIPNKRVTDPLLSLILSVFNLEKLKESLVEKMNEQPGNKETTTTEDLRDTFTSFLDIEGNLLPHLKSLLQRLKIPLLLHSKVLECMASILMGVLTRNNGSPIVQNFEGRTAVHCAAANESANGPQLLELLLAHKGNPNVKDHAGWTSLHCAAANKGKFGPKMMEILLQRGGDANMKNKDGKIPLDLATSNRSECAHEMLALLEENSKTTTVKKGIKMNISNVEK